MGELTLNGSTSNDQTGSPSVVANFAIPPTADLTGTLSETGKSTIPDDSFISLLDSGASQEIGTGEGFSSALPPGSGAYRVTLVNNRTFIYLAGLEIGDDSLWVMPDQIGAASISISGATTRDFVFPVRPQMVTVTGKVTGPEEAMTTDNIPVRDVSVSVVCRGIPGAPGTAFAGSTSTDASGNYTFQILGGTDCEVGFSPNLGSGVFF
jgi:hypothetical protein